MSFLKHNYVEFSRESQDFSPKFHEFYVEKIVKINPTCLEYSKYAKPEVDFSPKISRIFTF